MDTTKKMIYLSGPIIDVPASTYDNFSHIQEKIEALGYEVVNPHEILEGLKISSEGFHKLMQLRISAMAIVDKVITLQEWDQHKDSKMEVSIARTMEIEVQSIIAFLKEQEHGTGN